MDSSEPGERCLPGMGLSGWMKRTMDRSYDLSDICNSPPVDGFFYPSLQQKGDNAGVAGKGHCSDSNKKEDTRSCTIMGGVLSIQPATPHFNHAMVGDSARFNYGEHYNNQATGMGSLSIGCNPISSERSMPDYMKPITPGFTSTSVSKQVSQGLTQNMMEPATNSERLVRKHQSIGEETNNWANSGDIYRTSEHPRIITTHHPADDSAPTPVDHIVSNQFSQTPSTRMDEGGSLRFVDKLGAGNRSVPVTPDVTPCTTPACSPQLARRAGNPFFTGGDSDNSSGSWLFRPGKKAGEGDSFQSEKLYEAKIEFQQQPNSKISKKTVRYVPRPSELRELNFWSPTSM